MQTNDCQRQHRMSTKEAQKVMFDILCEFDEVCKKHNLTYWLDHGTLLGAVRHKGFIPWDDDLDVTMPREDYEKFLHIAQKELPKNRFLQYKKTDKQCVIYFSKIRDNDSCFIDAWEESRNVKYHQGIYIDIFPLNKIKYHRGREFFYKNLVFLSKLFYNRYWRIEWITAFLVRTINKLHNQNGDFVVSGGEAMHYVIHVPEDMIYPLGYIEFEGENFPAPKNIDGYLKSIFGSDYMSLPASEKRKVHSVGIYRKVDK